MGNRYSERNEENNHWLVVQHTLTELFMYERAEAILECGYMKAKMDSIETDCPVDESYDYYGTKPMATACAIVGRDELTLTKGEYSKYDAIMDVIFPKKTKNVYSSDDSENHYWSVVEDCLVEMFGFTVANARKEALESKAYSEHEMSLCEISDGTMSYIYYHTEPCYTAAWVAGEDDMKLSDRNNTIYREIRERKSIGKRHDD